MRYVRQLLLPTEFPPRFPLGSPRFPSFDLAVSPAGFRCGLQESAMSITHLNQVELSRRWNISARTLERWRWLGQGPQYLKIGCRVVYRLADIEAYEAAQLR